jgi:membrane protease YdiL (CAAX protease family)
MIKLQLKWKLYIILLIGSIFGALTVLPYQLSLLGVNELPSPLYIIIFSVLIQTLIIFGVVTYLGLILSKKVGLGLPILEGWLQGRPVKEKIKKLLGISIGLGLLAGILIIFSDFLFSIINPSIISGIGIPNASLGFLSSFYGAINEEILLRLFLMSLIVFIIMKIKSGPQGNPTKTGIWISIIISAIIFGAGHLPTLMASTTITPILILRTILLNSIGGIIFGWLYWKNGLESAMISHFSADIVLHALLPLLLTFSI